MTSFTLNGSAVSVQAEPETMLLWVIRDELHLTGTKYGCGAGLWVTSATSSPSRASSMRWRAVRASTPSFSASNGCRLHHVPARCSNVSRRCRTGRRSGQAIAPSASPSASARALSAPASRRFRSIARRARSASTKCGWRSMAAWSFSQERQRPISKAALSTVCRACLASVSP
jgi:hypothetical protein